MKKNDAGDKAKDKSIRTREQVEDVANKTASEIVSEDFFYGGSCKSATNNHSLRQGRDSGGGRRTHDCHKRYSNNRCCDFTTATTAITIPLLLLLLLLQLLLLLLLLLLLALKRNRPEINLWGWKDVKIQELINSKENQRNFIFHQCSIAYCGWFKHDFIQSTDIYDAKCVRSSTNIKRMWPWSHKQYTLENDIDNGGLI